MRTIVVVNNAIHLHLILALLLEVFQGFEAPVPVDHVELTHNLCHQKRFDITRAQIVAAQLHYHLLNCPAMMGAMQQKCLSRN